jgi:hypothetical protein
VPGHVGQVKQVEHCIDLAGREEQLDAGAPVTSALIASYDQSPSRIGWTFGRAYVRRLVVLVAAPR